VDVAVDSQRNVYIVDEKSGVWIFTYEGRHLTTVMDDSLGKPRALTLMPDGAILVYDDKQDRVVRFH
jgi:hypothetical protein